MERTLLTKLVAAVGSKKESGLFVNVNRQLYQKPKITDY